MTSKTFASEILFIRLFSCHSSGAPKKRANRRDKEEEEEGKMTKIFRRRCENVFNWAEHFGRDEKL